MAEVQFATFGDTWRAEYGEINSIPLFRFGYRGGFGWEYTAPVAWLSPLIAILEAVAPVGVDTLVKGEVYQARKRNNLHSDVVVEPRTDTAYPVQYFDLYSSELAELISTLNDLSVKIPSERPDDWDATDRATLEAAIEAFNQRIALLESNVENAVTQAEGAADAANQAVIDVNNIFTDINQTVADEIAAATADIGALQDGAIAGLLSDPESASGSTAIEQIRHLTIPTTGDLFSNVTQAITSAQLLGIQKIVIPTREGGWSLSEPIIPPNGFTIDAQGAEIITTVAGEPAFYLPISSEGVTLLLGLVRHISRLTYSDLPTSVKYGGAGVTRHGGVLSHGQSASVSGEFKNYRFGVRFASWDGVEGSTGQGDPRYDNRADVLVSDVDFGLIYTNQVRGVWNAVGSFVGMDGSPDPAHLVYSTLNPNRPSRGCKLSFDAYDSSGYMCGIAASVRTNADLHITKASARNVPGVLELTSARGDISVDSVTGSALTGSLDSPADPGNQVPGVLIWLDPNDADALYLGSTSVTTISLSYADGVDSNHFRGVSSTVPRVTLGAVTVTGQVDDIRDASSVLAIRGDSVTVGPVRISNTGSGGLTGLRVDSALLSRFEIASMSGVTTPVRLGTGVASTSVTMPASSLSYTSGFSWPYSASTASSVSLYGLNTPYRSNYHFSAVQGSPSDTVLDPGVLYLIPLDLSSMLELDQLSFSIQTGSGLVSCGVWGSSPTGSIGARLATGGTTVSSGTTGSVSITVSSVVLTPGRYWVGIRAINSVTVVGASTVLSMTPDPTGCFRPGRLGISDITSTTLPATLPSSPVYLSGVTPIVALHTKA